MKEFFDKPVVKKILTWVLVLTVGAMIFITQFAFPVSISYSSTEYVTYSDNKIVKDKYNLAVTAHEKQLQEQENPTTITADENGILPTIKKDYEQLLSDSEFDFSDSSEYLNVIMNFNFLNIGMYKVDEIQFQIESIGKFAERFVSKDATDSGINRFSSSAANLSFIIYIDGMTDDEIMEAVNSISISYSFNRPELFGSGGVASFPEVNDFTRDKIVIK